MKRGYSIIETVVVIAISVVALVALANIYVTFNALYGNQQIFLATAGSAGTVVNALEAAILPADQVLASYTFSGTPYASSATTLVLELPSVDASGDLIAGAKDYIVFYTSGTMLYRLTEAHAGSARASGRKQLSATVSAISFTYDNADMTKATSVTADVQTSAQFKQQTAQGHLTEQIYLRNL